MSVYTTAIPFLALLFKVQLLKNRICYTEYILCLKGLVVVESKPLKTAVKDCTPFCITRYTYLYSTKELCK